MEQAGLGSSESRRTAETKTSTENKSEISIGCISCRSFNRHPLQRHSSILDEPAAWKAEHIGFCCPFWGCKDRLWRVCVTFPLIWEIIATYSTINIFVYLGQLDFPWSITVHDTRRDCINVLECAKAIEDFPPGLLESRYDFSPTDSDEVYEEGCCLFGSGGVLLGYASD